MNLNYCLNLSTLRLFNMDNIERCKKCTLHITWETLYFDEEGLCNIYCKYLCNISKLTYLERTYQFEMLNKEKILKIRKNS